MAECRRPRGRRSGLRRRDVIVSIEPTVGAAAAAIGAGLLVARAAIANVHSQRAVARLAPADGGDGTAVPVGGIALTALESSVAPMLRRAGVTTSVRIAAVGWLTIIAAAVMIGIGFAGGIGGLVGAGLGALAPVGALVMLRGRADLLIERSLPDALEAVGRSVRSGASLVQAIDEARSSVSGPLVSEIDLVVSAVRLGNPLAEALDDLTRRRPLVVVRLAVAALLFSAEAGGMRSQAIDGLAASLRDRVAVEREIQALASQARFSAMIIALLPVGFVAFSSATDPRVLTFLTGTGLGRVCLVVGLGLDLVGLVWMRQLTGAVS